MKIYILMTIQILVSKVHIFIICLYYTYNWVWKKSSRSPLQVQF